MLIKVNWQRPVERRKLAVGDRQKEAVGNQAHSLDRRKKDKQQAEER
jgi:hypothetical protein